MKNFDDTPAHKQLQPPAPLRFPGGPEIIDTQALWTLIPGLFAQLAAMFTPDHVARGAATRTRELGTQLQMLYKTEAANFKMWLTRALKADPEWQAEVREDLGGDAALARWNLRREKLLNAPEPQNQTSEPKPERKVPTAAQNKPARPPRGIKTDRRGLFRLASLRRPHPPSHRAVNSAPPRLQATTSVFKHPGLISLTPDDLRPASPEAAAPRPANTQTPSRAHVLGIWERLHVQLMVWNYHLIMADVGLKVPACRDDIMPP